MPMSDKIVTPTSGMQHRIFRADTKLSTQEINELLGIRVKVPTSAVNAGGAQSAAKVTTQMFMIAFITLLLAGSALVASMYQLQIGPFFEGEVFASVTE